MASVNIETSIIGYLTARSRDAVIFKARQELTRAWWDDRRNDYELFSSELVLNEISAGDPTAAAERVKYLDGIRFVDAEDADAEALAEKLLSAHLLPEKAKADAAHVALASVFELDYLLTWNCKHIANADTMPRIYAMVRREGFHPPLILTPQEFSNRE